jgi:hypothetical protein
VGEEADPGIWRPAPGRLVYQCCHVTRARPWKAPKANRKGKVILKHQTGGYRTWKTWSAEITMDLYLYYRLNDGVTVDGPVDLDILFVLGHAPHDPDRTNLLKSFEDLLQGFPYRNDRQVQGGDSRLVYIGEPVHFGEGGKTWEGPERIHWRVSLLG